MFLDFTYFLDFSATSTEVYLFFPVIVSYSQFLIKNECIHTGLNFEKISQF